MTVSVEKRLSNVEQEIQALKASMEANTHLTVGLKKDVADWREETMPIVDAMKTMEAGIRTIGRIGTMGAKLGKTLLILVACWGALKLIALGASWTEISSAFMRAIGR